MSGRDTLQAVAFVAVVVLFVATAGAAATGPVSVSGVTVSGPAVLTDEDRPSVADWRPLNVTTTVTTGTDTYDVCVGTAGSDAAEPLGCQRVVGTNSTANVTVALDSLPENATGTRELTVTVHPVNATNASGKPLATGSIPVRVLAGAGDADDDGLTNRAEFEAGSAFDVADTDGDGLGDGVEVNTHETDPTSTDTDDDGLGDGVEVNDQGTNPSKPDTDGDGLSDGVEVTTHGTDPTSADTDGDGLDDGVEVTMYQTAPRDTDTDGDGLSDGPEVNVHETSPTKVDTDGDGLDDAAEVERYGTNPTEPDTDGDGLTDGREVNQYGTDPTRADTDGDGVDDTAETASGGASSSTGPAVEFAVPPGSLVAVLVGVSLALVAVFSYRTRGRLRAVLTDGSRSNRTESEAVGAGDGRRDGPTTPTGRVPAEAMTDESRVRTVVDDHGGRVRQSVVVEETGWSKSKVSRVLSQMADEGTVEKISLGRENLITRPDARPDGAKSPFDPPDEE